MSIQYPYEYEFKKALLTPDGDGRLCISKEMGLPNDSIEIYEEYSVDTGAIDILIRVLSSAGTTRAFVAVELKRGPLVIKDVEQILRYKYDLAFGEAINANVPILPVLIGHSADNLSKDFCHILSGVEVSVYEYKFDPFSGLSLNHCEGHEIDAWTLAKVP